MLHFEKNYVALSAELNTFKTFTSNAIKTAFDMNIELSKIANRLSEFSEQNSNVQFLRNELIEEELSLITQYAKNFEVVKFGQMASSEDRKIIGLIDYLIITGRLIKMKVPTLLAKKAIFKVYKLGIFESLDVESLELHKDANLRSFVTNFNKALENVSSLKGKKAYEAFQTFDNKAKNDIINDAINHYQNKDKDSDKSEDSNNKPKVISTKLIKGEGTKSFKVITINSFDTMFNDGNELNLETFNLLFEQFLVDGQKHLIPLINKAVNILGVQVLSPTNLKSAKDFKSVKTLEIKAK